MGRKDKIIPTRSTELPSLGAKLRHARQQKGITLTEMAGRLKYTKSHLSAVENGVGRPSQELVESYERALELDPGEFTHTSSGVALALGRRHSPLREDGQEVLKQGTTQEENSVKARKEPRAKALATTPPWSPMSNPRAEREDWGEVPTTGNFYGREQELDVLKRWIVDARCHIMVVLGIGGVGKTVLAMTLARQITNEFNFVFWRSLQHTSPIEDILKDCIRLFPNQQQIDLPMQLDRQITLLMDYLQKYRCLIVLDNFEAVLQGDLRTGQYRDGYEEYGKLIERCGEVQHKSCLLLTSREKPKEIARMEAWGIRSFQLLGVGHAEGQQILKDKGLFGPDEALAELIRLYSGNPLALQLVSAPIRDLFAGNVAAFLEAFLFQEEREKRGLILGDINKLLDEQFQRLSEAEREILYWLAIEGEAVSLNDLKADSVQLTSGAELLETLEALRHRSLIEPTGNACFRLQSVIMEYVIASFVKQVYEEIEAENAVFLVSHLLIKAQAKDYVKGIQTRSILAPLAHRLLTTFGKEGSEKKLRNILAALRETHEHTPGYAAGNILNLLIHLQCDLRGYDFSDLVVWQANLQDVSLPEVNFARANLDKSVFSDTFGRILCVVISPDGARLAAGTGNGDVRLWDAPSGRLLRTCQGHTDWVRSLAFSVDGKVLVSGSDDQTVRIWDVDTGQCLQTLPGGSSRVYTVACSPDGKTVACGNQDQTVRTWDLKTEQCLQTLAGHTDRVWSVAFSPDGNLLASGSEDQTVRLWDLRTGQCLKTLRGHSSRVWSVAFSPDGRILASGSEDQTLQLWEVSTGRRLKTLKGHASWVRSIAFSPDGNLLVSGSEDYSVRIWEVRSGECRKVLRGHSSWVRSVAFSPDGKTVVSGSEDQTVRTWDVSSGNCLKTLKGHTAWVYCIAFSPDGKTIASGSEDQVIRLWEVGSGQCYKMLRGHSSWIRSVAFSPNGEKIVSGSEDQTIRIWDVNTEQSFVLHGHPNWVYSVAFSPDGKTIASGSEDQTVRLWEVSSGQCLKTLQVHTSWVRSVAFSPDGKTIASGSEDQTVRLWDVDSGACLAILKGHSERVYSVTFSPDGKTVVSGSEDQTVRVWGVDSKQCLKTLAGHNGRIWSVAFSPDGKTIASGSEDQTVRLWNTESGQSFHVLQGHSNRVYSVAFSPDGKVVGSGSPDGTIKLWNVQTGELVQTLRSERPYEHMNITGVENLTIAQKATLKALGAIEK